MKKLLNVCCALLLLASTQLVAQQQITEANTKATNPIVTVCEDDNSITISSTYDVRIELVDERSGQPVDPTTLPGYAATNLDTNQIYYPGYYDYNEFYDLPAGTYRFDSYDGYFDGSSSEIVTLSSSLEGNDGFIVVTLQYWSE